MSYEDLDADHTQFDTLRSWLVDGDACASAFDEKPETIFKIHGDAHWQKYISNWNEVSKSLQGTRYAVYLDEAYVPRGGDAWEKLRDAPVSPKEKVHDTYQPHTKTERPGRLYPRDVPGCVTAGKDHHCRMKTYGNRTVPLFTSTPTSSPVVAPVVAPHHKKKSWLGSWLRWPFY